VRNVAVTRLLHFKILRLEKLRYLGRGAPKIAKRYSQLCHVCQSVSLSSFNISDPTGWIFV